MPSVQLSPNRFTALDLCSPVALTFPDVLDLSNHLHSRGAQRIFGHASYLTKVNHELILYSGIFMLSTASRNS